MKIAASDRETLIKLASSMPKGDENRRAILARLVGKTGSWSDIDDGRGGSIFNRKLSTPEKQASVRWSKLTKSAQDLILDGLGFDALPHGARFSEALALMGSERDRLSLVQTVLEF